MSEDTELLTEIRDLLRLMAEPALAKRDERLRATLQQLVGKSVLKATAVALMDGTRTRGEIRKDSGINDGDLSRLLKSLREEKLISAGDDRPRVSIPLPANFIDNIGKEKG